MQAIAERVHDTARRLATALPKAGLEVEHDTFFDTVLARVLSVAAYLHQDGAWSDGGPGESEFLPGHSLGRLNVFLNSAQVVGDDEQQHEHPHEPQHGRRAEQAGAGGAGGAPTRARAT